MALAFALAAVLAAQPAPSLQALVETPELSSPTLAPDGRTVAYRRVQACVARNAYVVSWWVVDLDIAGKAVGRPRPIADGGQPLWLDSGAPLSEAPQWSADGRWLYYRALVNGAVQVWRADRSGGGETPVTADPADVQAFRVLGDGRLIYRVGPARAAVRAAEAEEAAHGVRIDRSVDVAQTLLRGAVIDGRLAAQRLSGRWFARTGLLGDTPPRFVTLDSPGTLGRPTTAADMAAAGLTSPNATAPVGAVGPGGAALRIDPEDHDSLSVIANGKVVARRRFDTRITSASWRPGRDALVVATLDPARRQTLWSWDLAHGDLSRLAGGNGLLNGGGVDSGSSCAIGATHAVCVAAGPLIPPHLVSIDLDTGRLMALDTPEVQKTSPGRPLVKAHPLAWKDEAGRGFAGVLLLPAGSTVREPLPLFLTYYDCPGYLRGGTGDEWPLAILAANGIAALCINKTSAGTPQNAVKDYEVALAGVAAIVNQLARARVIDSRRVGMGGLSFGSEVTMWVATHSNLLSAVSIASPQLEPQYYWFNDVAGRDQTVRLAKIWGLGDPEVTADAWRDVSPALQAERIRAPILMQLVEQEFRYEMELYAKLTHSPVPVEMWAFADEPHILTQPVHRLAAYQRNLDWFRFWLQDVIDPDPAKADQYRRWIAQRTAWRAAADAHARSQISTSASSNRR